VSTTDTFLTFLGTGTSVGVPVIGCSCDVCISTDPCNNRTRASLFISTPEVKILIDSGPDLRQQALRENITEIDAVLYTHSHLDHVVGFDELRAFCWGKSDPLPLYASDSCLNALIRMFGWAFQPDNTNSGYIKPDPRPISNKFTIGDLTIYPLPVIHGTVETHGYRFDTPSGFSFAYLPDVKSIPEKTLHLLDHLDLLIIDSLRSTPHSTHLSLPEVIAIVETLSPKRTLLTHISHEMDHATLSASLTKNISPAYDGLKIPLLKRLQDPTISSSLLQ
jgi:phosphoribosyl 1,2-cyclic phosphate phosphodiesterase